ncbi:hypothetical protein EON63_15710 [archaeon]|nr:MAG: hypothetical protein EON63_15710 [archaeon]
MQTYYTEGGDAYYVCRGESYWSLEDVPEGGGEMQIEMPFVDEYGNAYWFNNTTQQYRPMN